MAGGIDELIDVLYGMVEEAWSMPLGRDKCLIERERVLDILDELRVNLPGEIKAARDVVEKRNELLAEGKREAESIRKQAEEIIMSWWRRQDKNPRKFSIMQRQNPGS